MERLPEAPPRYLPRAEREAYGKSLRERVRRVDQNVWIAGDRDVLARLRANEVGRRDELPIRHARMASSPFGFLRGGASIMAPDLAALPSTGYLVQLCGDAHVRNLGAYASPDGQVVFDINDFDETCRGPWEWDLKRLAISIVLVGREAGTADKIARSGSCAVRSWRMTLHEVADSGVELARYRAPLRARPGRTRVMGRANVRASRRDELTTMAPTAGLASSISSARSRAPPTTRAPGARVARVVPRRSARTAS
jgi:hypothetical protein